MKQLIDILLDNKTLVIVLGIILLSILICVLYLIKLSIESKKEINKESSNEPIKEIPTSNKLEESFYEQMDKDILSTKEDIKKDFIIFPEDETDEATAVISTEELLNAKENYKSSAYGDEETITAYEQEQEKTAIISYDELLSQTQTIKLKDIEKAKEKEKEDVKRKPFITNTIKLNVSTYIEEDKFLASLKEFRLNLR